MKDLNQDTLNLNSALDNQNQLFVLDGGMVADSNKVFLDMLKSDNSNNIDLDKYIFEGIQNSQINAINKETNDIKANNNCNRDILTDNNQQQRSIKSDDNRDQYLEKGENVTYYTKSDIEKFKTV